MSNLKFKKELDGSINIITAGGVKFNGKTLLDLAYPVNSYYISEVSTSPAEIFGGTWEQLPEGYTLWSTTTDGEGGKTIDAGLPNITGRLLGKLTNWATFAVEPDATLPNNAFERVSTQDSQETVQRNDQKYGVQQFNFDASRSNSIYGNSETVQPPAVKVYMWKRIS